MYCLKKDKIAKQGNLAEMVVYCAMFRLRPVRCYLIYVSLTVIVNSTFYFLNLLEMGFIFLSR
jgi:hypothetical protein